jgi:hypothetical protein
MLLGRNSVEVIGSFEECALVAPDDHVLSSQRIVLSGVDPVSNLELSFNLDINLRKHMLLVYQHFALHHLDWLEAIHKVHHEFCVSVILPVESRMHVPF